MGALKWLLVPALIYCGVVAALYFGQRALMYFPDTGRTPPAEAGLAQAEEITLTAADGERLVAWHIPPQSDKPLIIYFQGNGGGLNLRAERFARLTADGTGLLALSYRGYGGSTGRPTEAGILLDADAAYAFATSRVAPERIVLWGESLGTGVAVAMAARHPVGRVLLESPFTSTVDIAAAAYWYVPVRWLMHDQFRSDLRIARVTAPLLVLHGTRDSVVPFRYGERLYALAPGPKQFIALQGANHNDHDSFGALEKVRPFLAGR